MNVYEICATVGTIAFVVLVVYLCVLLYTVKKSVDHTNDILEQSKLVVSSVTSKIEVLDFFVKTFKDSSQIGKAISYGFSVFKKWKNKKMGD